MRRSREDDEDGSVSVGALRIDGTAHRVFANDEPVQIGPTEYRLLHFFMTHPERVYTRTQLLDHVWGGNVYVEERTVDVHIRRLRKTREPYGLDGMAQTVPGAGYRFAAAVGGTRAGGPGASGADRPGARLAGGARPRFSNARACPVLSPQPEFRRRRIPRHLLQSPDDASTHPQRMDQDARHARPRAGCRAA